MVGTISRPVQEFKVAVAMGAVVNSNNDPYIQFTKFGSNLDVPSANFELLSSISQPIVFTQAPESVRVRAGGSADDDAAGSGARNVTVIGIDENLDIAFERVDTAGATESVFTTLKFWRVFAAEVHDVGVYGGSNVDDINIENESGDLLLRLLAETSVTQHAAFAVPREHTALIRSFTIVVEGGKEIDVVFFVRNELDNIVAPSSTRNERTYTGLTAGVYDFEDIAPIIVEEKSDLYVNARADQGGGSAIASISLDILLIPGSIPDHASPEHVPRSLLL